MLLKERKPMSTSDDLKNIVKEAYGKIAEQPRAHGVSSCCGSGSGSGCGCADDTVMADNYLSIPGYVPEADLGLGCGIPTEWAGIEPGHTVLDLGSGAGNDVFVARRLVGDSGTVIGVDFTETMIGKANANKEKLGYTNVEFRLGDIEQLPVDSKSINVVISNCVLNLVPDKPGAFSEIFRVLKPGGHFSISDIVTAAPLPEALQSVAELYAGCVSGASVRDEYLEVITSTGFRNVRIVKEKKITIPAEIIRQSLRGSGEEEQYPNPEIYSVTIVGEKP